MADCSQFLVNLAGSLFLEHEVLEERLMDLVEPSDVAEIDYSADAEAIKERIVNGLRKLGESDECI